LQQGRGIQLGPVHTEIASATCKREPVCALVVAVFAPQAC
jgi:arginine decarboxylase